jgi:hypothetical protein
MSRAALRIKRLFRPQMTASGGHQAFHGGSCTPAIPPVPAVRPTPALRPFLPFSQPPLFATDPARAALYARSIRRLTGGFWLSPGSFPSLASKGAALGLPRAASCAAARSDPQASVRQSSRARRAPSVALPATPIAAATVRQRPRLSLARPAPRLRLADSPHELVNRIDVWRRLTFWR